jgi:hypothetical protein
MGGKIKDRTGRAKKGSWRMKNVSIYSDISYEQGRLFQIMEQQVELMKKQNDIEKRIANLKDLLEKEKVTEEPSLMNMTSSKYSEEHIRQQQDPRHNQWGYWGEPKKNDV